MTKKKTFNQTAAPTALPLLHEWERLCHELLEDPAAALPLDARQVIYSNAAVRAQMDEENRKRAEFNPRMEAFLKDIDFDAVGEANSDLLMSLAGPKVRKSQAARDAVMERTQQALDQAFGFLAAESARRKESDVQLKDFVLAAYEDWLNSGVPTEQKVTLMPALRMKPRAPGAAATAL